MSICRQIALETQACTCIQYSTVFHFFLFYLFIYLFIYLFLGGGEGGATASKNEIGPCLSISHRGQCIFSCVCLYACPSGKK